MNIRKFQFYYQIVLNDIQKIYNMDNKNIVSFSPLIRPNILLEELPSTNKTRELVSNTRKEIENIIDGTSSKKLFIVGPCSIHNADEALEYGSRLKKLSRFVNSHILIVMRVYFEKPRTTVGWKGLINDPHLNNSFKVNDGLKKARKLLLDLNNIGMPCACEILDTITPQYISDLISWGAIGARTTESQVHRQMVSGLSMPVGFKNGTDGNKIIARDGILSAQYQHCFMGITDFGEPAICKTQGNKYCHTILRGGKHGPNYYDSDINEMEDLLDEKQLSKCIMVDCSHGNSNKDFRNQEKVLLDVVNRMKYQPSIKGVMVESNLHEGKQPIGNGNNLKFGVSVTDSCIGFLQTNNLLTECYKILCSS